MSALCGTLCWPMSALALARAPAAAFAVAGGSAAAHSGAMDAADGRDIRASLAGDGEAYERLVRRHQGAVAGRMWRFTRDPRQLEELVHEVFVEAYFSLSGYRGRAPFAHWLNRVATRVGYRFWKRRRRADRAAAPLADWDTVAAEPPPPAEAGELLHRLLGQLGPRDRLVLTLIYLEGHSVAETTDLTGWSRTLVKVQAHRARKRLRALLERAGAGRENGPWTS